MLSSTMNKIMTNFGRFERIRQLHTIISQETIKPSSPTPHHLKTHKLQLFDQLSPSSHVSYVYFYKNHNNVDTNILKKSLSQSLTKFYPFAGRLQAQPVAFVDCNDQGIEFLEASNDSQFEDFIFKEILDGTLDQIIPNGAYVTGKPRPNLVEVQLIHFAGGGLAIAVSISHKVADGFTMVNFVDHWATLTRGHSPIDPIWTTTCDGITFPDVTPKGTDKYVTKRFVFLNSKLNELKEKVNAMGTTPINPTRVEVLTSLLYRCATTAAATKTGSIHKSMLLQLINMRNKINKNCPKIAAGNIYIPSFVKMADSGEFNLNEVIEELRRRKMEIEELGDVQEVGKKLVNILSALGGDDPTRDYCISSTCRFPYYDVDFGWGKPIKVTFCIPNIEFNSITLLDTASGDGIEAVVHLEKEEMNIFHMDKEFLEYVKVV